ncbi:hypothetical protein BZL30_5614 [Mycobacterium kansasii]|uniref:Uncharacterized protein n=1 Tax=Mycobacterium kansasii TaxID=1768 RepID=A0A1V3WYM7_MYCKA|nr:hypothetical protein BZL30_5614 [Mycobacterium kansasii]
MGRGPVYAGRLAMRHIVGDAWVGKPTVAGDVPARQRIWPVRA